MKNIILMIALAVSVTCQSQIKQVQMEPKTLLGKIAPMGQLVISLEKSSDNYIFTYRDVRYSPADEYDTFTFKETGDDLENLYGIIISGIESQPKENTIIELPSGFLVLKFDKVMGSKNVQIGHVIDRNGDVIGFSRALTKRDVDKLFGKNK